METGHPQSSILVAPKQSEGGSAGEMGDRWEPSLLIPALLKGRLQYLLHAISFKRTLDSFHRFN